jgi:hypothetical protein
MTMASPKPREMHVAMGRAVYGTPQMMSYWQPRTAFHIMRDTCTGTVSRRSGMSAASVLAERPCVLDKEPRCGASGLADSKTRE